jgi:hypothetical protein
MVVIANAISEIIFHDYNNTNVVMEDIRMVTTWMFTRYGGPILEIKKIHLNNIFHKPKM